MKLHELLELGLTDLKKQEETPGCIVDMGTWLQTTVDYSIPCHACLAGSVLRHTLGQTDYNLWEQSLAEDDRDEAWLEALDALRRGQVLTAAVVLGLTKYGPNMGCEAYSKLAFRSSNYATHPEQWWAEMRKLQADLKAANL